MKFASDLRQLRSAAGDPPYRKMAKIALFSPSVLSSAASGHRLPTLPVTLAFVDACGGDRAEWERRWHGLRKQLAPDAPEPSEALVKTAGRAASPPSPLDMRPSQLPIGPADFVGRQTELSVARQAVSVVSDTRVPLVINGPVGVGKTVFAFRLAHQLADDFPDGQLFADMGGNDGASPYEVMAGFLAALGVARDQIPPDHGHRTGLYRSMLAQRRVIVVLDNVGEESQVRPLLARSMRSQILVTSRARLLGLDGVRRIAVDVFPRSVSMELIRVLIGEERMRAEREVCFRLAELCEDLPLAITIAGRKIAGQPDRPVSGIVGPPLAGDHGLHWLRVGDTSLTGALTTAYRSLSALSLEVFHRLGRGGIEELTPGNIARSMRITVDATEHALERLVDHGLLHRISTTDRYVMPTLVNQFSRDKVDELHRYVISTLARRPEGDQAEELVARRPASRVEPDPMRAPDKVVEPIRTPLASNFMDGRGRRTA